MIKENKTRTSGSWWRPPALRADRGGEWERHVTWLELFFDLVFVVAVAELAHLLHDDLTSTGLLTFALLFIPVWWLWIDFSYYGDQYDTDDVLYRVAVFAAMFGILVFAAVLHGAFTGGSLAFAATYLGLRLLLIGLYYRAWRYVAEARELAGQYLTSFSVAAVIWLVSLFVPEPWRFALWGLAILIEISNGPIAYATVKRVPQQVSHMDERFGLFTIVVLGESIVAVATGTLDAAWQWRSVVVAIGGFTAAVCMWWVYFDWSDSSVINQALRSDRRGLVMSFVYGYSHLLVYAAIAAASVGIQAALEATTEGHLGGAARAALCGGVATFLLGLSLVHWSAPSSFPRVVLLARLLAIGVVACLGLANGLGPVVLVVLLALTLLSLVLFELPRAAARASEVLADKHRGRLTLGSP